MDKRTIDKLTKINQEFYRTVGKSFDETRQHSWPGWKTAWESLRYTNGKTVSVLDMGCGNGRFVDFLSETEAKFEYTGIDSDNKLLEIARDKHHGTNIEFVTGDVTNIPVTTKYDLVVCFAVFHHIPSEKNRRNLIRKIANRIKPDGRAIISLWNFTSSPRLMKKAVNWSTVGVDETKLEEGDYLLSWNKGSTAYRYCHSFSEAETNALIKASGLTLVADFYADGREDNLNRYLVLRKATS